MSDVWNWDNLLVAYRKAVRGKRSSPAVAAFEHQREEHLLRIQEELRTKTYQPSAYQNFCIHEPKRRLISAAPFRDRVIHHALCNQIEPIFDRSFVFDSYANRRGKGTHRALTRVQVFSRRFPYVLQCDIRQFFPSIDHEILKETLHATIKDGELQWLIDCVLASGVDVLTHHYDMVYFPDDNLFSVDRSRGLPIGNLTSQFWANCYMSPFDHFVKRELRCPGYVRYVDDFLLFAQSKGQLWEWKQALQLRLERLRLTIHQGAHPRPCTEGIPFLGFLVYPHRRRLKRRKGVYYARKLRSLNLQCLRGLLPCERVSASLRGWMNHARYGNTTGLQKAMLSQTLRRSQEIVRTYTIHA